MTAYPAIENAASAVQPKSSADSSEETLDLTKYQDELKSLLPADKAAAVDEAFAKIQSDKPLEVYVEGLVSRIHSILLLPIDINAIFV